MFVLTMFLNWINDLIYQRSLGEIQYDVDHSVADGELVYTDQFGIVRQQTFTGTNRRGIAKPRLVIVSRMFSDIIENGCSPHYIRIGEVVFTQAGCYRRADFKKREQQLIDRIVYHSENPQPRHFVFTNDTTEPVKSVFAGLHQTA